MRTLYIYKKKQTDKLSWTDWMQRNCGRNQLANPQGKKAQRPSSGGGAGTTTVSGQREEGEDWGEEVSDAEEVAELRQLGESVVERSP